MAVDAGGAEQARASVPTPFAASAEGVEMAVADLDRALVGVIAGLGAARGRVAAVGLTGMAESGAPLRGGRPAGPVIAWHDGRGEATVASLERRFGPALARWTGRRVRTVSSVAKLGWLLDHGLAGADRWLGVPELGLFRLTGEQATEFSLAARTGAYDVVERRFRREVIEHVLAGGGTPGSGAGRLFPPVRPAGSVMGLVSRAAAAGTGLVAGIPVTVAGHDHLAAAAGLGARPDDLLNSVGTAETLLRRLPAAPDVDRALALDLAVTVWPGGDAWGLLASCTRSGLVVDALAARLGLDPPALDRLAASGPEGPPAGHVTPGAAVDLPQGISVAGSTPGELWTATLRVLADRTAAAAGRVAQVAGPAGRLVVFGGGSRSAVGLRLKTEALGIPVVGCPVTEAAAHGAALAAGLAAGWWPDLAAAPTPPLGPG